MISLPEEVSKSAYNTFIRVYRFSKIGFVRIMLPMFWKSVSNNDKNVIIETMLPAVIWPQDTKMAPKNRMINRQIGSIKAESAPVTAP